jgi:hypothetical protein
MDLASVSAARATVSALLYALEMGMAFSTMR